MQEKSKKKHCTILAMVTENNVIGKDGKLPCRLPSDLTRFWHIIENETVVAGRLTYECMPKKKLREFNVDVIVLTGKSGVEQPNLRHAKTFEDALRMERRCGDLYVIGGENVYRQAMEYARTMVITRVKASIPGDTFFPEPTSEDWDITGLSGTSQATEDEFPSELETWTRYV